METRFYVSEPGDCDHLTDKAQKMLALYRHALCDTDFLPEEVESIRDILRDCGQATEVMGKRILRAFLVASNESMVSSLFSSREATAMIGRLDQEIAQWESELEELSLSDEETDDEKLEWFAEEYSEEISTIAGIRLKEDLGTIVESNPSLVDADVIPCTVKTTDADGVSHHQEFALQINPLPGMPVTLTIDDLELMLSVLKDYKPVEDGQS